MTNALGDEERSEQPSDLAAVLACVLIGLAVVSLPVAGWGPALGWAASSAFCAWAGGWMPWQKPEAEAAPDGEED